MGWVSSLQVTVCRCSLELSPVSFHCPSAIFITVNVFEKLCALPGILDLDVKMNLFRYAEQANKLLIELREKNFSNTL